MEDHGREIQGKARAYANLAQDSDNVDRSDLPDKRIFRSGDGVKISSDSVLQEAQRIIHGDRRQQYGHPKLNFARIAKLWAATLEIDSVTPEQVALCLMQLKVARLINNVDRDGMVDVAGYVGCLAMIVDEDEA